MKLSVKLLPVAEKTTCDWSAGSAAAPPGAIIKNAFDHCGGNAIAKATVMRLLACPSRASPRASPAAFPGVTFLPGIALARLIPFFLFLLISPQLR